MGALSSLCCEEENKKEQRRYEELNHQTVESTPKSPTRRSPRKARDEVNEDDPVEPVSPNRHRSDEEIMGELERYYPPPIDKKIGWESFEITHKIGSGGFGDVFLGELKENKLRGMS